ncbi:MAG: hypothetical protein PHP98_05275 [Kiritimatiellae bacterium]|nr:hypothetical protein [Kiritimatiellia bacterium]
MNSGYMAAALLVIGLNAALAAEKNLIENGNFDVPGDPLRGWVVDYAWSGNEYYIDNAQRVSIVPNESGRKNVMRLDGLTGAGTKVESSVIPFDIKQKYRATLFVKGGPYRIYFAGYQWKPGIRPHDNPKPEELRMIYRSKTETGTAKSWQSVSLEIPGAKASSASLQHLGRVRFIRLYVYVYNSDEAVHDLCAGFIDGVLVERIE